jgi:hypothetical protein
VSHIGISRRFGDRLTLAPSVQLRRPRQRVASHRHSHPRYHSRSLGEDSAASLLAFRRFDGTTDLRRPFFSLLSAFVSRSCSINTTGCALKFFSSIYTSVS